MNKKEIDWTYKSPHLYTDKEDPITLTYEDFEYLYPEKNKYKFTSDTWARQSTIYLEKIKELQKQITALTEENSTLKEQVEELKEELQDLNDLLD